MNSCTFTGHLTADPVMRKTKSGIDVCNFRIAVQRPGTKREDNIADFFNCVAWGGKNGPGLAGSIGRYFHKGDGILVVGVMQQSEYTDKNGAKQTGYELVLDKFEFPLGMKQRDAAQTEAPKAAENTPVDVNDSDLPF